MYQQVVSDSLSVETVFSAISDNKSLSLFNIIGFMSSLASDGQPTGEILISRMNLTRRQYYTRFNRLVDAGLITQEENKICSYFTRKSSLRNPQDNRCCNPESMET